MTEKPLISRLKRLAWRSRRPASSQEGDLREKIGRLRLVRPSDGGGAPQDADLTPVRPVIEDCTMDIVVKSALGKGILTPRDLSQPSLDGGLAIDWRTVCLTMNPDSPKRADTLRRFAAEVYGFQQVTLCEIGTLVLGHVLKRRLPRKVWRECFRLDCIPVAPHGRSLSSTGRLMLASPDPARAAVRNLLRSMIPGQSMLVYAGASVVTELKSLLASELPHVGAAVGGVQTDSHASCASLHTTSRPAAAA